MEKSDEAHGEELRLDFTYARTALFVRQTLALALRLPLNQEFTWPFLKDRVCDPTDTILPKRIVLVGISALRSSLPEEAAMLLGVFRELRLLRPDIKVMVVLH